MGQLGQKPDQAKDGSFLPQTTVPGASVGFFLQSTTGIGTLTLDAAGGAAEVGTFQDNLVLTTPGGKVAQWDKCIAWPYVQFYVDTATAGHEYRNGGALTAGQKKIEMESTPLYYPPGPTPSTISHITDYGFRNYDASPHTIIGIFQWKYVLIA